MAYNDDSHINRPDELDSEKGVLTRYNYIVGIMHSIRAHASAGKCIDSV